MGIVCQVCLVSMVCAQAVPACSERLCCPVADPYVNSCVKLRMWCDVNVDCMLCEFPFERLKFQRGPLRDPAPGRVCTELSSRVELPEVFSVSSRQSS